MSDLNKRALSAIRGIFGPDSAQYDRAGGVRTSERKKPVRSTATATAKKAAYFQASLARVIAASIVG